LIAEGVSPVRELRRDEHLDNKSDYGKGQNAADPQEKEPT
jgi:hypothetical protein